MEIVSNALRHVVKHRFAYICKESLHNGGMSTTAHRIRSIRRALDLTQEAFADAIGRLRGQPAVSRVAVANWEANDPDKRSLPDRDNLIAIAKLGNTSTDWLLTGHHAVREAHTSYGRALEAAPLASFERVWIVGETNGGFHGYGLADGPHDEYVEGYAAGPGAYALRVRGNSGGNRIREGDIISVSPTIEPATGEEVVVMLNSGEHMVKELVSIRPDSITVADIGDERKRRIIDRRDLQYIHAVIGIHPPSRVKRSIE